MHIGDEQSPQSLCWSYAMWPAVAPDGSMIGIVIQITESSADHQRTAAMNQALIISSLRHQELTEKAEALNVQLHAEVVDRKRAEEELRRANEDLERFMLLARSFGPPRNFVLAPFRDKEFTSLLGVGAGWSEAQRSPKGGALWA
jgi:hypothetical protein